MKVLVILVFGVSLLFGIVDVNKANKKELMSLKGIGSKKADMIIKYRKAKCFKTLEGLIAIKGIGQKSIENNRKELKAGKCKNK